MENLPFVVLKELFKLMDNLNAVIRCSHVCRNWRAAYQTMIGPETVCLYFQKFIPLNHRLFYTNGRVFRFQFLRLKRPAPPRHELRFLDFETIRTHFANLKKLVIFDVMEFRGEEEKSAYKIRFLNQLNSFKLLEYVEIHGHIEMLEGSEIDLPNLRVLCLDIIGCETRENVQALLTLFVKATSLEAIRMTVYSSLNIFSNNSKFVFPRQLKHLDIGCFDTDFKFHTELPNLECLIFKYHKRSYDDDEDYLEDYLEPVSPIQREDRLFGEDFLKLLPGLKLLVFKERFNVLDLPKLKKEKLKFNLKDLKILEMGELNQRFEPSIDYLNWRRYVAEPKLRYWPDSLNFVFDKLLKYQVPLDLFKENFFRISDLRVGYVADQQLLVDLLRNTKVDFLILDYDCNLGQSFFEEFADSVLATTIRLYESVWARLSDSVLSKLNVLYIQAEFEQFRPEAVLAILSNSACFGFSLHLYESFLVDGRQEHRPSGYRPHSIWRVKSWDGDDDEFYCQNCDWYSWKQPARLKEGAFEVTIDHAWDRKTTSPHNMTWKEWRQSRGTG